MSKVRVYELAKELGVESKVVVAKLQEMGEFVRSASSTIEAPVVRRLIYPDFAWCLAPEDRTYNSAGQASVGDLERESRERTRPVAVDLPDRGKGDDGHQRLTASPRPQ